MKEKEEFLRKVVPALLEKLSPQAKGMWGLMNPQQMVEHLIVGMKISNAKIKRPLHTSGEQLPAYRKFLESEKEFRPNTKNPVMPDTPVPVHYPNLETAIDKLKAEINDFFIFFETDKNKITLHPIFGELDYAGWIQMHHKHFTHHLKQFGLI